ncbi:MAG: alpha/beta fold hydrolase [Candidatus Alcyoniella australis]|nr:alpha/beta fold hydrolase [Candidatus Alcyoniella australis]
MHPDYFPSVFVRTRASAELECDDTQLHASWLDLRRDAIRLAVDEPWPEGTGVSFSFTVLDDPLPVEGQGRVVLDSEPWDPECGDPSSTMCWGAPRQASPRYMTVKFESVQKVRPGKIGLVTRSVSTASKLVTDAARYALGELGGNGVVRELEHRLPGYREPVLLLYGLFGTRGALGLLEERLKRDAFSVFSFRLGLVNIREVSLTSREVAQKVEEVCKREGIQSIDVIGHSMGGLIGLHYIKFDGGDRRVRRFVAVGAPFGGSGWAYTGMLASPLIPSLTQLMPGSQFLRRLREAPLPSATRVTCIAAKDDLLVPVDSAVLPGARNVLVPRGHAGLVTSQAIYPIVRDALS